VVKGKREVKVTNLVENKKIVLSTRAEYGLLFEPFQNS